MTLITDYITNDISLPVLLQQWPVHLHWQRAEAVALHLELATLALRFSTINCHEGPCSKHSVRVVVRNCGWMTVKLPHSAF